MTTIWLDMDGTIADLYGVEGWLEMLTAHDATPYAEAKPLVRMATLARLLNNRQRNGYKIGIVSALARNSNAEYDERIKTAKREWLAKHLHSVKFDEIKFVPYTFKKPGPRRCRGRGRSRRRRRPRTPAPPPPAGRGGSSGRGWPP